MSKDMLTAISNGITPKDFKQQLRDEVVITTPRQFKPGGQHTNDGERTIILIQESMGIELHVGMYSSLSRNREAAWIMFEALLEHGA